MTELKPCPFCKNDFMLTKLKTTDSHIRKSWYTARIVCDHCEALGPKCSSGIGEQEALLNAIAAWNERKGETK